MTTLNPWRLEGVSIVPEDLADLMPLVGQKELYEKLVSFKQQTRPRADGLTGFFVLVGGWGVGKSRVGHELCLEAVDEGVEWIVDGQSERVLQPSLAEGILPLFVRYSQVTEGPLGDRLATETWIPIVVQRALALLVDLPSGSGTPSPRNQARLLGHLRTALRAKGFDRCLPELRTALGATHPAESIRGALDILRRLGIGRLWLVVDEIEDITDVSTEGLPDPDRKGIDQALLTVIPRVIKYEEVRQDFPELSFLLLCARSVGDTMQDIRALQRRTGFYDLQTNAFADVQAYFDYLEQHRPAVFETLKSYPPGLKEAAFFAANRNFGWFNVIMSFCHANYHGRNVSELLRSFAEQDARGDWVFDRKATSDANIRASAHKPTIIDLIYRQLPQRIGARGEDVEPDVAGRLIEERHSGIGQPLFALAVEWVAPAQHEIMDAMRRAGFEYVEGNTLRLPGETGFDLSVVLDSLRSYSIGLEQPESNRLLVFERVEEFAEQIRALTPYESQAEAIAGPLHRFLTEQGRRVEDDEEPRKYLAPSFTFLLQFNRLNRRGRVEAGYLRDATANTRLEEAFRRLRSPGKERTEAILRGLAQVWNDAVVEGAREERLMTPSFTFTTTRPPLALGAAGRVTLLYGSGVSEEQLLSELGQLAPREGRWAHPIVVVFESAPDREENLPERVRRQKPGVAPFVIARSFTPYQVEILIRQGLLGRSFSPEDLRTNLFMSGVGLVRQHLDQALRGERGWQQAVEDQGLILRPIFFRRTVAVDDLRVLAKGYALMLGGASLASLLQPTDPGLTVDEKDLFKKRAGDHVEPPSRYEGQRSLGLFTAVGDLIQGAAVPRALVALLRQFGPVTKTAADLEPHFLYEAADPRPGDVVRQAIGFLHELGFLTAEGSGRYRRVSEKSLLDDLDLAEGWLDRGLPEQVKAISKLDASASLRLELDAKDARAEVRRTRQALRGLSLEFDLEPEALRAGDALLAFATAFAKAVGQVTKAREASRRIYQLEEDRNLTYSPDLLAEFERAGDEWPLWKRARILTGFGEDVRRLRAHLVERIDALLARSDGQVPEGPDGVKLFPTQVLSNALGLWRQELLFSADQPGRSISGVGTAYLPRTLGFKIASGKYEQAWARLDEIEAELTGSSKLVDRYLRALDRWQKLREGHERLRASLARWEAFFADAPAGVATSFGLADRRREIERLGEQVCEGGIREATDEREAAGVPTFDLLHGLEGDLGKVDSQPSRIEEAFRTLPESVLTRLQEEYTARYGDLMDAFARILAVQCRSLRSWPNSPGETYGATAEKFDALVCEAESVCAAYFDDVGEPTWKDYVDLCGMRRQGRQIPWEEQPFERWTPVLMRKGLIRLELV